jgi:hypothetical protein
VSAIAKLIWTVWGYGLAVGLWANTIYSAWSGAFRNHAFDRLVVDLWLAVLTVGTIYLWTAKFIPTAKRLLFCLCLKVVREHLAESSISGFMALDMKAEL